MPLPRILAFLAFGMLAQGAQAQSPAAAQPAAKVASQLTTKNHLAMCIGCHGIPGYKTAYPEVYHVPKIYGQQQAYIVKALQAYKSGERSHPSMQGIARGLSDEEMTSIAAYYAGGPK
jgi:cytochrome c553